MEGLTVEEKHSFFQNVTSGTEMSTEVFQDFLCKLFEKKGILNDLRAYLRGHIVSVLRSAQTGDPVETNRHLAQRLDITYQAFNILIAEYLLALEFSYTLSVFVSEIPLANMVFDFAKTLMKNTPDEETTTVKFTEKDVFQIIKCLGVKCDSRNASSILDMYQSEKQAPLLLCILKCAQLTGLTEEGIDSDDSLELSSTSSASRIAARARFNVKCPHYAQCQTCKGRFSRLIEYYRTKNNELTLILEQLKAAYRKEMLLIKEEENRKLRWSIANHALVLQKRRDQLEETFKTRETELLRNLAHKKKFLWGIARALRNQHERMSRAMLDVKAENKRLLKMESSLKEELMEAKGNIKKEGESVRCDISNEMCLLESKMEALQRERSDIERQRVELEQFRLKMNNDQEKDAKYHDLLKKEIAELKQYIQSMKSEQKISTEVAMMTQVKFYKDSEANNSKTDLNTLKDQKKEKCDKCDAASETQGGMKDNLGSTSGETSRSACDELLRLKQENTTLRRLAQQQSERIEELCAAMTAEQEARARPGPLAPHPYRPAPFDMDIGALDGRNGGGEALCLYANASAARPRVLLPGDNVPFIGVLHDNRHSEARRHIINQWRALRRRFSPPRGVRPRTKFIPHTTANTSPATDPTKPEASCRPTNAETSHSFWKPVTTENAKILCNPVISETTQPGSPVIPEITKPGNLFTIKTGNTSCTPETTENTHPSLSPVTAEMVKVTSSGSKTMCSLNVKDQLKNNVENYSKNLEQSSSYRLGARSGTRSPAGTVLRVRQRKLSPAVSPQSVSLKRDKSPQSVLREAKEKLRNQKVVKEASPTKRDKSPGSVLREAKLRLRKLEMEANAVEKSYRDFRKRHTEQKEERLAFTAPTASNHVRGLAMQTGSNLKFKKFYENNDKKFHDNTEPPVFDVVTNGNNELSPRCNIMIEQIKATYENYRTKSIDGESEKTITNAQTIEKRNKDFLGKPLSEFRKLYYSDIAVEDVETKDDPKINTSPQNDDDRKETEKQNNVVTDNNLSDLRKLYYPDIKEDTKQETATAPQNVDDKKETPKVNSVHNFVSDLDVRVLSKEDVKVVVKSQENIIMENESPNLATPSTDDSNKDSINEENQNKTSYTSVESKVSQENGKPYQEKNYESETSPKHKKENFINEQDNLQIEEIKHYEPKKEKVKPDTEEVKSEYERKRKRSKSPETSEGESEKIVDSMHIFADSDDDIAADIDNYYSRLELRDGSHGSVAKLSEDENFWD